MPGEMIAERYEVEELVGTGGMSSVYRARDTLLERLVALKVLHPHYSDDAEYVERFRREARSVAQLSHPHIVTVIDRGEDDGQQFIVFEYVDGENLKQLLARTGPLPARRALELAIEIADALTFAHEHGLVHRDVKPQNVLVSADGDAKVTDFGIARSLDVEHGVTQTGTVLGTSNYLSPEQASGKPTTPSTDVYSLGVVLYELLTGEVPFPGENFVAVAMKHLHEQPPDVLEQRPDISMRLAAAVDRALEKDPALRFPSMDQFARELRQCLAELDAPVRDDDRTLITPRAVISETPPRRVHARRSRTPAYVLVALIALIAVAAIVTGIIALGGSKGHKGRSGAAGGGGGDAPVTLSGVGDYTTSSHQDTHGDTAARATDGNPQTYWMTQRYATPAFGGLLPGLGLVLDAGKPVKLEALTVTSSTPGFTANILAGDSPSGGFTPDSGTQTASGATTFTLNGKTARYYVVWITKLPSGNSARIEEVRAR
jgi:serine/threonine-protein kinase